MNLTTKQLERFNSKIKKTKSCWLWEGAYHYNGYGCIKINNKTLRVNRLSWFLKNGKIPKNRYVLHKCDNPKCVNPKHLFLGTAQDNIDDCIKKGRFRVASGKNHGTKTHPERIATGERHGSKTHPEKWVKGEKISWAKLNDDLVRKIRKEYIPGVFGTERLAKKYGVSQRAIYCLVTRQTWKHV